MKTKFWNIKTALVIFTVFLIGLLSGWGLNQNFSANEEPQQKKEEPDTYSKERLFDDLFNDDFFHFNEKPFEEMRRMQEKIFRYFDKREDDFQRDFDNWYSGRFGGGSLGDIQQKEDEKNYYYEVDFGDEKPSDIQVQVGEGQIAIKGKIEKTEKNSTFLSSFSRSFPLPMNAKEEGFTTEIEGNKIVVTIPKL